MLISQNTRRGDGSPNINVVYSKDVIRCVKKRKSKERQRHRY